VAAERLAHAAVTGVRKPTIERRFADAEAGQTEEGLRGLGHGVGRRGLVVSRLGDTINDRAIRFCSGHMQAKSNLAAIDGLVAADLVFAADEVGVRWARPAHGRRLAAKRPPRLRSLRQRGRGTAARRRRPRRYPTAAKFVCGVGADPSMLIFFSFW